MKRDIYISPDLLDVDIPTGSFHFLFKETRLIGKGKKEFQVKTYKTEKHATTAWNRRREARIGGGGGGEEGSDFRGGPWNLNIGLGNAAGRARLSFFSFTFDAPSPFPRSRGEERSPVTCATWRKVERRGGGGGGKEKRKKKGKGKKRREKGELEGPSTSLEDICAESGMNSRLTGDHPGQNGCCVVLRTSDTTFLLLLLFVLSSPSRFRPCRASLSRQEMRPAIGRLNDVHSRLR